MKKKTILAILVATSMFLFACSAVTDLSSPTDSNQQDTSVDPADNTQDSFVDDSSTDDNTSDDLDIPTEYQSALTQAKSYSQIMNMSKAGIYDQLTSEYGGQFSAEAAQYAVDHVAADWNANALAKAKEYGDNMHLSKAGIYEQLTSEYGEKFTAEEAQYAVDNVDADWNANALAKAKEYQEQMSMSPEAIRDQLTSEYGEKFTSEEADYAISNLR